MRPPVEDVLAAYASKGTLDDAARSLGVSKSSMQRWIAAYRRQGGEVQARRQSYGTGLYAQRVGALRIEAAEAAALRERVAELEVELANMRRKVRTTERLAMIERRLGVIEGKLDNRRHADRH